ncbi:MULTISPECIES: heavy metal-binding domain-containing protein [Cyanophyceae]|uniref:heavy metal-binding domain-containing protein n=1 Tax=unclassified Leptolyngbya TaxID=2650499 RepID=UPI001684ADFC|nr:MULTISPECIES: heavy metal-binding domain-containing protein [unclassified Phormidium]MBD1916475.1 heavy metal-binding domain-containing protein [Phormidium sp. FACHB-77]MBD2032042.1 heavy metal-binding domain-containing protein [Phormidium sp. FACHB-322]MBD2052922.1 heavy metal-binding domain-containing protein [Leptolyngbya sp. FACHB-60]
MILATTATIEGEKIVDYYGIVSSETILGANILKDFLAAMRDMVGGRSASYEKSLRAAKETALKELTDQAETLGANAVVGIALDYETIDSGGGSSMLMVAVSGTAVRYQEPQTV